MEATAGIFSKFERDELNKITAKSILEKLMNIRQKIDVEFTARRLIWELMQNAKDNASLCNQDGEKVDVVICLRADQFIFSHNKGYFTNEHIRGLIRKYSSSDKTREADAVDKVYKTTGRFGTGFMTTHLLSEKVQIESYYRNESQTFNQFSFWLDRSGRSEPKIIEGINNAFDEAEGSIKKSPSKVLEKSNFKTSFTYPLTPQKKALVEIALEEVKRGIAYTLINVPEIRSVTINEESTGDVVYAIAPIQKILHDKYEFTIQNLLVDGKDSERYYLIVPDGEVQVIIPVSYDRNKYYASELDASIPRLHLDFPMIGTENLNLPFVINSPLFEPTEPRDGVSLIDDADNDISQMNCGIVIRAVNLYSQFLSYVGNAKNWNNLYNLARIKPPEKHSWIDLEWFMINVINPIREQLLYTPIVDVVSGGRISIWSEESEHQVFFPYSEKEPIREEIWKLAKIIYPQFVPIKEHINQWNEIIWGDCYRFSMSVLSQEIDNKGGLLELGEALKKEERETITFLNKYYSLLNIEAGHIKDILADQYMVIPNQLGQFRKKSDLRIDKGIDEEIKNACSIVSEDPREYLLHKDVLTGNGILYPSTKQDDIISKINTILKEDTGDNISKVCDYLVSLFATENSPKERQAIFDFSKRVYPDDFTKKRKLEHYDEKIWEESDKKSLFFIVSRISEFKTTENAFQGLGFDDKNAFLVWLDTLVTFLVREGFENNISREKHPILPNQNGEFRTKDNLFLDDGNIDEQLKDISKDLGHDFRIELLDKSIFLELPQNRTYTIETVAEKISTSIKPILRDVDKRKVHKDTLKKFYMWMNENKVEADAHFSDLFEKRFLFLEDDDISTNMKKATEFDQLMQEHGIKSMEELRTKLASLGDTNPNSSETIEPEKVNITKEILVSLGITSQEELEEAFKDPAIFSRFFHTSTPTTDMFIYAQGLIARAKQNIIKYLREHPDYECKDIEETAPTILAGIVKNGVTIQIVCRPSDNGEVIIYYSSEKDTLDSDTSELWVDNGITAPHILTLGRILKSTGINKIPINMN